MTRQHLPAIEQALSDHRSAMKRGDKLPTTKRKQPFTKIVCRKKK